ncbi:MAG: SUMF1/EgtB/PvdO family nonheme iron enzyme [Phycisphaerae bacterium]|jgi:formylglycine-generating enzyme required for sulfatase activity
MLKCVGRLMTLAAVFGCVLSASATIVVDTVTVGNPGNPGELSGAGVGYYGFGPDRICGGVDYVYEMGKYEITAGQYTEFLNAVAQTDTYALYSPGMCTGEFQCGIHRSGSPGSYTYSVGEDWAKRPVLHIEWQDTLRFANWMHNGQPSGAQGLSTTEDGSYYLNGATEPDQLRQVTRQPDATWVLPNEDEWYKSAYHKNDGVTGNYWMWPVQCSMPDIPDNGNPDGDSGHSANYCDGDATIGPPYWTSEVGYFSLSASPYGTYDQGGNAWEYVETLEGDPGHEIPIMRGFCFYWLDFGAPAMLAGVRFEGGWSGASVDVMGFRLAQVPEPATLTLLALAGVAVWRRR